ncbi:PTS-dependent dihydroxyacetone kinase phosphotransferase subunit DhaM, partial [Streptomyces massasporeus]|uniref:PTS-dependent dihydroxyacetone kinase phosphotransferase subunit DhaM n=1 Tax=Streptomyces massasporeus TaxID=67324 RepID=UPI00331981BE
MSDEQLVGIVLVSHSAAVAASVAELAKGLAGGGPAVPVAPAGGTEAGGLGTSSELIAAAAASVDRGAGVAVLTDLGSAVLTVKALLAEGDELPEPLPLQGRGDLPRPRRHPDPRRGGAQRRARAR